MFLAAPVMRVVLATLFPSQRHCRMAARLGVESVSMRFLGLTYRNTEIHWLQQLPVLRK